MDAALRDLVWRRAVDRCEYCHIPQAATPPIAFHIEHIVARQHGGGDQADNLALACDRCNAYTGPNLTSVDPESDKVVLLFHPRRDTWQEHFQIRDGRIIALTPTGRATVRLLEMNAPRRVELRLQWLKESDLS